MVAPIPRAGAGHADLSDRRVGKRGSSPAPVIPENSYHVRRTSTRVSREPPSGINRQAVSYDRRFRRFRRADLVSAEGAVDHVDSAMSSCP